MNSDSLIYCIVDHPFNIDNFKIDENLYFSEQNLISLKKNLTENLIENILMSQKSDVKPSILFYSNSDNIFQGIIDEYSNSITFQFFSDVDKVLDSLSRFTRFLFFYNDVIVISAKDIQEAESLISNDENTLLISKSFDESVCFLALNKFDEKLFNSILTTNLQYDEVLLKVSSDRYFIHTTSGQFRVISFSNFKLLYKNLSTKESSLYCSQEMLEKFTNLFIEYRDFIK
jgi:hypothetical protein